MKARNNKDYPLVDEMIAELMNEHYEELKEIDAFPLDVFRRRLIRTMYEALVKEQVQAVCRTIEESLCVSKNTVTKYRR